MNVVVTGCSRGIGKEIVNYILNTTTAQHVIAISRNFIATNHFNSATKLHVLNIELTNFTELSVLVNQFLVKNNIAKIDVLINNAGAIINKPFGDITSFDIDKVMDVNFKAPYILTQALLPYLIKSNSAHVVNIGSMGGYMGSLKFSGLSVYSASKGALAIVTECLAEEFKEKNIAVNCLCLGAVNTEMLNEAFPGYVAPTSPKQMAEFIVNFALTARNLFNGKVLPISSSTP